MQTPLGRRQLTLCGGYRTPGRGVLGIACRKTPSNHGGVRRVDSGRQVDVAQMGSGVRAHHQHERENENHQREHHPAWCASLGRPVLQHDSTVFCNKHKCNACQVCRQQQKTVVHCCNAEHHDTGAPVRRSKGFSAWANSQNGCRSSDTRIGIRRGSTTSSKEAIFCSKELTSGNFPQNQAPCYHSTNTYDVQQGG